MRGVKIHSQVFRDLRARREKNQTYLKCALNLLRIFRKCLIQAGKRGKLHVRGQHPLFKRTTHPSMDIDILGLVFLGS
jgi:hypothetical protein